MGKRQSAALKVPRFGAFLRQLREHRDVPAREVVARQMAALGIPRGKSALEKYERSRANVPPIYVLWALAKLYDVPFEELVDRLLDELELEPVEWQRRPLDAEEVAKTKDEVDLLRHFREMANPEDRLFVRDTVARFAKAVSRHGENPAPKRRRRARGAQPREEASDEPAVTNRKVVV